MSEKGQGQNGGGQGAGAGAGAGAQGASPGGGSTPPPPEQPTDAGGQKPAGGGGGGQQANQKKPPNPNPPSGTLEFPDGGRLTGEGGKWRYTDPSGRTGNWTGDGWVDDSGQPMPDDFHGRAPDPNRVREGRD
jgi:hypothetical protein